MQSRDTHHNGMVNESCTLAKGHDEVLEMYGSIVQQSKQTEV